MRKLENQADATLTNFNIHCIVSYISPNIHSRSLSFHPQKKMFYHSFEFQLIFLFVGYAFLFRRGESGENTQNHIKHSFTSKLQCKKCV